MFSTKKANFAPTVTTGIVLFNVFLFILIGAFASDDIVIGTSNNLQSSIDNVNDTYSTTDVAKPSFLGSFSLQVMELPGWFKIFVVAVNVLLIPITILAWVRGL